MQFLFSRKCLALLGIGALIFSVAFWKAHETEAQQTYSVGGSASANWLKGSAQVSLSFHKDPRDYKVGDDWEGEGETHVESSGGFFSLGDGHGPSVVKAQDNGSIYIEIMQRTNKSQITFTGQVNVAPSVEVNTPVGGGKVTPGSISGSVSVSHSVSTTEKYADIQGRSCSWTRPWAWKRAKAKGVFEGASVGPYVANY